MQASRSKRGRGLCSGQQSGGSRTSPPHYLEMMDRVQSGVQTVQQTRYEALDSLRGVCACVVVLFHFQTTGIITNLAVVRGGALFVDFFFVLSGFVIAASYGQRLESGYPLGRYMVLRFGRIYPLHLAVLALFLLMEFVGMLIPGLTARDAFTGSRSLTDLALSISLLQVFDPPGGLSWNAPAWSIAAEFWTYALAGGLFVWGGRAKLWMMIAVVIVSGAWLAGTPNHLLHDSDFGIVRCIFGFFIGSIAFVAAPQVALWFERVGSAKASLLEAAFAGLSLWLVSIAGSGPLTMLAPPLFALALLVFANERGLLSSLLLMGPMRLLGRLSYSIYMVHAFVQGRFLDALRIAAGRLGLDLVQAMPSGSKALISAPFVSDLLTIVMLLMVIAVSAISYRLVEMPAREWSRKMGARIQRANVEVATPSY